MRSFWPHMVGIGIHEVSVGLVLIIIFLNIY